MLYILRIGRHGVIDWKNGCPLDITEPTYFTYSQPRCCEYILINPNTPILSVVCNEVATTVTVGCVVKVDECESHIAVHKLDGGVEENGKLPRINTLYGRCPKSMKWLDELHRTYIEERHQFATRSVAVRAVAGSGKTTMLLRLAKRFKREQLTNPNWTGKSILYVAFNKQLVEDIKHKLRDHQLQNTLCPMTFDALIKRTAETVFNRNNEPFHLIGGITPHTLTEHYDWFKGKAFKMKKSVIADFATFCQHPTATHPTELYGPTTKKMVTRLWEDTLNGTFLTFDGLRKRAHLEHWLDGYLDDRFGLVFVDEAQDFDPIMLDILKTDAKAPKVFVGDPKQQIYEWRGTINAFEQLPDKTLVLEFYKTFRMGEPATSQIATLTKTPMISGIPDTKTELHTNIMSASAQQKYTFLCRSWKGLLTSAQTLASTLPPTVRLWVHDYDKQIANIERLYERLTTFGSSIVSTDEYEDDLPSFLMKLAPHELQAMRNAIESRRVFIKTQADIQLYTIHSFKGMEADVVRVCGDIDPSEEPNLYYVALTRGRQHIYRDHIDTALVVKSSNTSGTSSVTRPTGNRAPIGTGAGSLLLDELREYRYQQASNKGIPAYRIFTNKTLDNIATACPQSKSALLDINGIGTKKNEEYGEDLLVICNRHAKSSVGQGKEQVCIVSQTQDMHTPPPLEPLPTQRALPPKQPPTADTPLLLCYYDIESTGLDTARDDIIQISIQYVKYASGRKTRLHTFDTFVNTDKPIPPFVQTLTRITRQHIQKSPYIGSVLGTVQSHVLDLCKEQSICDVVWIAHNGNKFDHKMLQRNCQEHHLTFLHNRTDFNVWYADTFVMAKCVFPLCPMAPENNKLQVLYRWCHARSSTADTAEAPLQFHRADADVKAMELVLDTMEELSPNILYEHLQTTLEPGTKQKSSAKLAKDEAMRTMLSTELQAKVFLLLAFRDTMGVTLGKSTTSLMNDALLLQLAHTFPSSLRELKAVRGFTEKNIKQFGTELLEMINNEIRNPKTVSTCTTSISYKNALEQQRQANLRTKGLTPDILAKLEHYNNARNYDTPIAAQLVKSNHQQICTGCHTLNGFGVGQMFFGGRQSVDKKFVKYCMPCMKEVLGE